MRVSRAFVRRDASMASSSGNDDAGIVLLFHLLLHLFELRDHFKRCLLHGFRKNGEGFLCLWFQEQHQALVYQMMQQQSSAASLPQATSPAAASSGRATPSTLPPRPGSNLITPTTTPGSNKTTPDKAKDKSWLTGWLAHYDHRKKKVSMTVETGGSKSETA